MGDEVGEQQSVRSESHGQVGAHLPAHLLQEHCNDSETSESPSNNCVQKRSEKQSRRRRTACGNCPGCRAENCGLCNCCVDLVQFGGKGTRRRRCVKRKCSAASFALTTPARSSPTSGLQARVENDTHFFPDRSLREVGTIVPGGATRAAATAVLALDARKRKKGRSRFAVGSAVCVKWMADKEVGAADKRYHRKVFAALVTLVRPDGSYDVVFEDGATEESVQPKNITERLTEDALSTDIHRDLVLFHGIEALPVHIKKQLGKQKRRVGPSVAAESDLEEDANSNASKAPLAVTTRKRFKPLALCEEAHGPSLGARGSFGDVGASISSQNFSESDEFLLALPPVPYRSCRRVKPTQQKLALIRRHLQLADDTPPHEALDAASAKLGRKLQGTAHSADACFQALGIDPGLIRSYAPGACTSAHNL